MSLDPVETPDSGETPRDRGGLFATTRWSVVVRAGDGTEAEAHEALETLCRTYWHPLYVYARRRGCSKQDAEDMTQAFLAHLMAHDAFERATPERGRFRSFLLASMNHFMADQRDKARALKRGGGNVVALDFQEAETWMQSLASTAATPEESFERRWAISLLEEVYRRLEASYGTRGKAELFEALKPALAGPREAAPYPDLAARLEMKENAVRVAVHRLRRDYRDMLRCTLQDLVENAEDVEDELRYLQTVLSR